MTSSAQPSAAGQASSGVDWRRFVELIRGNQRFLLTAHIRPDCDSVGSELAMAAILQRLGKEVRIINPFELPPNLRFLDPEGKLLGQERLGDPGTAEWIESTDVLMVLDTTAWAQLGDMCEVIRATKAIKMVVDHHLSGDDLGAELFKNTEAEATGRLVAEAAGQLKVEITPEIARALFAAVATDTGWFRFSSTSADTYRLAAQLAAAGAKPDQVYKDLYENDTLARLQLIGRAMARVETELDGRLIHTWLERADFDAVVAIPQDSEDVINMTLSVGGTQVAVILVEQPGGGFKISFRSRSDFDCRLVAEQFGGGGHKKAAGAFLDEPLASAQSKVLDGVRAAMR
ncbi:MAG: DHH family phosphoesterase [Planctomycetota bacterium]